MALHLCLWIPLPIPSIDRACLVSRKAPLMGFDRCAAPKLPYSRLESIYTALLTFKEMTQILIALIIGEQRGPELAFRHCYLFILFFLSRTTSALASTGDTVPLTYLIPTQIQSCSSLQLRKAMEVSAVCFMAIDASVHVLHRPR